MNILYHHRTFSRDGQEIHVRALQRALVAEGHRVREVALAPKGVGSGPEASPRVGRATGQRLLRRTLALPTLLREIAEYSYTPVGLRRLTAAHRGFRTDFIYERYAFGNAAGVLAARRLGLPLVLEVNSPLSLELAGTRGVALPSLARRVERFILSRADLVCVVSEQLRDLAAGLGARPERTVVMPNGVDLELFRQPPPDELRARVRRELLDGLDDRRIGGVVVAGFVGYFRAWHRLDDLLEAVAGCALENLHLAVIGDGQRAEELRRMAGELGVSDRIHWLGPRPPEAVPDLLAGLDMAVVSGIPPYACPLKLIEYMAAGLPVAAPDQPNIRELVHDRENALLFSPSRPGSLADALAALVTDPRLRSRLGRAARGVVERRRLTWRDNARRVVSAVRSLPGGHLPVERRTTDDG